MESKSQTESETLELKETGAIDAKTQPEDLKGKDEGSELINNKEAESKDVGKKMDEQYMEEDEKKDVEKPLIDETETVTIDLGSEDEKLPGEDAPTLPMSDKKKQISEDEKGKKEEEPPSKFPRLMDALSNSKVRRVFDIGGLPFLPLAMIIIGSIFINDCPLEPSIPLFLIVNGVIALVRTVKSLVTKYRLKKEGRISNVQKRWCTCLDSVFETLHFIWFIAGCVWVYRNYEPNYTNPYLPDYCHKTLYLFAFWVLNVYFIIIICLIILLILCAIILCIAADDD